MTYTCTSTAYDAASRASRAMKWGTTFPGPNKALENDNKVLRARSRKASVNNGYAEGSVQSWLTSLIGSGVFPISEVEDSKLKKEIQTLATEWFKKCGSNNESFAALQWLAARSAIVSGECLGRFRYRRIVDRLPIPLQIQLLEGDHLDDVPYKWWGKNRVKQGIEIDKLDNRVAYHLSREHPSDTDYFNKFERVRVPARDIVHLYRQDRPGQMRGVTWLASILVVLFEIDEKETADNVRRKFNSLITVFLEDNEYVATDNTQPKVDSEGNDIDPDEDDFIQDDIEPGAQIKVPAGKKVTLSEPASSDPTDEGWLKAQLRKAAAGLGLPAYKLTKDLTDVNYSSIRAGLIEFRRLCEALLQTFFVELFCVPIWNKFMDMAVALGKVNIDPADYNENPEKYRACSWNGPAWDWVDPLKDVTATLMAIRGGLTSRQREVRKRNSNTETIDAENAEDLLRAELLDLAYDCFPSQTKKNGEIQTAEEDLEEESRKDEDE